MENILQREEKATEYAESRRSFPGTVKGTIHALLEETGTFQLLRSTQN